jgi:multiple antibiotic resistance protein
LRTLAISLPAFRIAGFIGATGNVVLSRLLGVILAALAVQYIVDGVRAAISG